MSDSISDYLSYRMLVAMFARVPGTCQNILDRMPDGTPDRIPDRISDRLPDKMSDIRIHATGGIILRCLTRM